MHWDRMPPAPRRPENASDAPASARVTGFAHDPLPETPAAVRAVLERGVVERRFLFPENGPSRRVERWQAPELQGPAELSAVKEHLAALEGALAPAGRGELLARVLAARRS